MANQEHLDLLKQGATQWNEWREQQPEEMQIDLRSVDLIDADLFEVDLHRAVMSNANLRNANLRGANLHSANLHHANFRNSDLRDADLSRAHLRDADFGGANLRGAIICDADLSNVHLSSANLVLADLSSANLRNARLLDTDLGGADLSNANLSGASLSDAYLISTNLKGANLRKTAVWNTVFSDIDLREVKELAELRHQGPSRIELHTIQLPQDGSALHFLRGAGVPDEWIDFYRAQMMHPVQYHSLFISYSNKDETLAHRLHADLQDHGVRCWFAPEDMKIGDKIRDRIDQAIHLQDKLLLLLSQHAIASAWVEDEVEAALEKEQRQQREVLFPVRLDESVMLTSHAWAAKLRRTRHIGDFTHWTDPQTYQQAFERLLRDLQK